jgi:hypothetical protein
MSFLRANGTAGVVPLEDGAGVLLMYPVRRRDG